MKTSTIKIGKQGVNVVLTKFEIISQILFLYVMHYVI